MRHKGLDEKLAEDTLDMLNLLGLASALSDPGLCFRPGLVQSKEAALASALDELIGLCDKLGTGLEEPRVGGLGLVKDAIDVDALGEVQRGEARWRIVLG